MAEDQKHPGGRPRKPIDMEEFEKLCALHCTQPELAAWFHISQDTLYARVTEHYGMSFSEVYAEKKAAGRISLRRAMWVNALQTKNTTMQIFLSKNVLGFGDRTIQETGTENEQSKLVIDFGADDIPPV